MQRLEVSSVVRLIYRSLGVKGLINTRSCTYSCTSSWWWVSTPGTCRAAYRNIINWRSRILLDNY